MPEISRFFGIVILLYYADHSPPHVHARYQGAEVHVDIRELSVLAGALPARALGLVMDWARLHQDELLDDWDRAGLGVPLVKIRPLD